MKLLVTGRNGQVASALAELEGPVLEVSCAGRPDFDLVNPANLSRIIETEKPDVIVSAAAYTAVDQAEDEPSLAYATNAEGAGVVAAAAAAAGLPVIHLSTDYVFSGQLDRPYREEDAPSPANIYGKSKLMGERQVAGANPRHIILRTSWVYSPFGRNFVKTMLRLASERDEVSVVSDQVGNPTSAADIASGIVHVAHQLLQTPHEELFGTFHLAGTGHTSWSGFARHIFSTSAKMGGPSARVRDIFTAEFPTKAVRPANSRLDTAKLERVYGWQAPQWETSCARDVRRCLRSIEASS